MKAEETYSSGIVEVICPSSDSEEAITRDWNNLLVQAENLAQALWQFRQHSILADIDDLDDNNFSFLEGSLKELAGQTIRIIPEP